MYEYHNWNVLGTKIDANEECCVEGCNTEEMHEITRAPDAMEVRANFYLNLAMIYFSS